MRKAQLARYAALGKSPLAIDHLRHYFRAGDSGDPWGRCMGWLFAVASHLHDQGAVPAEWEYQPGAGGPDHDGCEWQDIEDTAAMVPDLLEFGEALQRLKRLLEHQGRDY